MKGWMRLLLKMLGNRQQAIGNRNRVNEKQYTNNN